jgi:hypothetical protein
MPRLLVQIHAEDDRGYINEYQDFYFLESPISPNSIGVHNEIAKYIELLMGYKMNNKIVLKKFMQD